MIIPVLDSYLESGVRFAFRAVDSCVIQLNIEAAKQNSMRAARDNEVRRAEKLPSEFV